jgi:hypothetical protein
VLNSLIFRINKLVNGKSFFQYFKTGEIKDLYIFVDASQLAYGAVAYFCNGDSSSFVFSKSRVAPLKTEMLLTIPQTKLMAAIIGTHVASSILTALLPLGLKPPITLR